MTTVKLIAELKINPKVKKYLLEIQDCFLFDNKDIFAVSRMRRKLADLSQEQKKLYLCNRGELAKLRTMIVHGAICLFNKMTLHYNLNAMNDFIDHPLITDHAFCMAIARTSNDLNELKNIAYKTAIDCGLTPIYSKNNKIMTFVREPK